MIPNPTLSVLGRKIAFSTFVQYAGKLAQMVLAMITLKLISNFLSENDYGVYAKISEYALFFSTAANLGIFGNLVRKMADKPHDGALFFNALILRMVTAVLVFVPAVIFVACTGGDNIFMIGTIAFFGALFTDYITSVCDGMLQANYMMGRANIALVTGRIINVLGTFLLIKYGFTAAGPAAIPFLFAATFLGSIVTALLSIYFVRSKIKFDFKINISLIKTILIGSLPFGIINIFNSLYFRFLPDYFAGSILDDASFASFNIYFRIAQVLSLFSTFLMFSVLPGFKEYIDQKHWHKARILFKKVWKIMLIAGALLVVCGSLFGDLAITMLTHKKYVVPELWFLLPLMLILAAVSYGYDLILIILFAMEKDLWILKREVLALTISLTIFVIATQAGAMQGRLALIIGAAIAAESFMVISGLIKIKKLWPKEDQ
jgi:O-antigen/teichoic acid export membrane protein